MDDTTQDRMRKVTPKSVPCPMCGARIGDACTVGQGLVKSVRSKPHNERQAMAYRIQDRCKEAEQIAIVKKAEDEYQQALTVACPKCAADPSQPCVDQRYHNAMATLHSERYATCPCRRGRDMAIKETTIDPITDAECELESAVADCAYFRAELEKAMARRDAARNARRQAWEDCAGQAPQGLDTYKGFLADQADSDRAAAAINRARNWAGLAKAIA